MKYDDQSWHSDGDFPSDLPHENGATHIAMFFVWSAENNLLNSLHQNGHAIRIEEMKQQNISYRDYFIQHCDGKLTNDDLNEVGNLFASQYYESQYYEDYQEAFKDYGETIYHIEPNWENYERIRGVIQKRFNTWLNDQ